jgi:TonB family protein
MTVVEALTQHQPSWDPAKPMEPVLPEGLPAPFAEIAEHCLRPDSQQRWTVAQVSANLEAGFRALQKSGTANSVTFEATLGKKKPISKWLYAVPIVVVGLATVAGLRMRQPHPEAQQTEAQRAQVQPEPIQNSQAQPPAQPSVVAHKKSQPEKSKPIIATSNLEAPIQPAVKPTPATPVMRPSTTRANEAPLDDARASAASTVTSRPESGSGVTSGSTAATATSSTSSAFSGVIHQVMPEVSPSARNTIQGHVRVRVRVAVDAFGNVTGATFDSPGPSQYFARKAMEAAQGWKFDPAEVNGRSVPSEWILRFAFGRTGTEVSPVQTAPKPTQ